MAEQALTVQRRQGTFFLLRHYSPALSCLKKRTSELLTNPFFRPQIPLKIQKKGAACFFTMPSPTTFPLGPRTR
jgi:hypothetical protein